MLCCLLSCVVVLDLVLSISRLGLVSVTVDFRNGAGVGPALLLCVGLELDASHPP
jgi:hypothetical protein